MPRPGSRAGAHARPDEMGVGSRIGPGRAPCLRCRPAAVHLAWLRPDERNALVSTEGFPSLAVIAATNRLRPYCGLLCAGGLSSLGFAPLNLWPLTFLSLALLIHQVMQAK